MKNMSEFFKFLGIDNESIESKSQQVEDYEKTFKKDRFNAIRDEYELYLSVKKSFFKMLRFMKKSLKLDGKKDDAFYVFNDDNGNIVIKNDEGKRSLILKSKLGDFSWFCEKIYFEKPYILTSRFCGFYLEYIVSIDEEGNCTVASPIAMNWNGIESFYGMRIRVELET